MRRRLDARRLDALERRRARLAGIVRDRAEPARRERDLREARERVGALIRDGLERAGLDPADAAALHRYEAVEPPLRPALRDAAPRDALVASLCAMAERLRGSPPPLASASPAELLAYYVFGDGAREAPG